MSTGEVYIASGRSSPTAAVERRAGGAVTQEARASDRRTAPRPSSDAPPRRRRRRRRPRNATGNAGRGSPWQSRPHDQAAEQRAPDASPRPRVVAATFAKIHVEAELPRERCRLRAAPLVTGHEMRASVAPGKRRGAAWRCTRAPTVYNAAVDQPDGSRDRDAAQASDLTPEAIASGAPHLVRDLGRRRPAVQAMTTS